MNNGLDAKNIEKAAIDAIASAAGAIKVAISA